MKTENGRDLTTVKGRLMEFLRTRKISRKEFSEAMGLSLNYVGAIRKSLPAERMRRLMELYPELNRDWLLYGEGEMLNDRDEPSATADGYAVPLLPVEASAGTMSQISQGVMPYECETIMSPVKGVDMAIKVCGDSMEPTFSNGDTLLIRKINDKAFIPWGHPVVIDTENGVLVKALYPGDTTGEVQARSHNPAYPPLDIPKSTVYGLYKIIGRISLYQSY